MNKSLSVLAFTAALGFAGVADATLYNRGNGLIYDDVLNITWLQDANYAKTSGYAAANLENDGGYDDIFADGRMGWDAAMTWADQLVYGGYSDWRLPTITDTGTPGCSFYAYSGTDCGYNVQIADTSTTPATVYTELAHMYYTNLGLKSYYDPFGNYQPDWGVFGNGTCNSIDCSSFGQNDVGLIKNLQAYVYWSSTEYAFYTPHIAWLFYAGYGIQYAYFKDNYYYAWAVRPGDVAAASPSIPEPGSLALVGLGLAGLGWARRRRG